MSNLEKAKLFVATGSLDLPQSGQPGDENSPVLQVLFNPSTLKVSLANSLNEEESRNARKAAQFIVNSSSSMSVELIFDTTDVFPGQSNSANPATGNDTNAAEGDQGGSRSENSEKDVRLLVARIANSFMKVPEDNSNNAPNRCLFAWGTFAFVGMIESMEETLDYFSPEGIPLRATVSLKITESRYQHRVRNGSVGRHDPPTRNSSGLSTPEAVRESGGEECDWRGPAMYNGVESPRLSPPDGLSIPSAEASASLKAQLSGAAGFDVSVGFSSNLSGSVSANVGATATIGSELDLSVAGGLSAGADLTPPGFDFGSSSSLGTSIAGAFSADFNQVGGISAGGIIAGGVTLRGNATAGGSIRANGEVSASAATELTGSVGFD